jgi:hypothetical protein
MTASSKGTCFLFGSGLSIPAGLPSTASITARVLSTEGISRHSDGTYFSGPPLYGMPDEHVPQVLLFLQRLKSEIDAYYSYNLIRTTSYEDLYSLASQINDSESGQFDNPALGQLIRQILSDSSQIFHGKPNLPDATWRLIDLSSEVVNYIRDVVWVELSKKPSDLAYLGFLKDALANSTSKSNLIFTLNHDTILETYLAHLPIQLIDGFGTASSQLRRWDPSLFELDELSSVRLIKLHGSINWFFFEKKDSYTLAIPLAEFWNKHPDVYPIDGRPAILVGTINKILQYSNPIYLDLQCCFHRLLMRCETLVVAGYSFSDKAINTRIIQWIDLGSPKKLIVIHPNPDSLRKRARTAIRNIWPTWLATRTLSLVSKSVENVAWQDIAQCL